LVKVNFKRAESTGKKQTIKMLGLNLMKDSQQKKTENREKEEGIGKKKVRRDTLKQGETKKESTRN